MSTTTNPRSLLYELRRVVPRRPLPLGEARQVAELQANRLLLACGIDEPGTPTEIIERLSYVQVSIRADMPTSGYSDWYKPHWFIMLNAAEPHVRRRFTLMHEFKHVLDHPFIDSLYLGRSAKECKDRAEQTADYFAACVLMPKRLVKRLFGQGHQSVSDLAACFGVSEVAMAFRLRQLGLSEPVPRCSYQARGGPAPGADEVDILVRSTPPTRSARFSSSSPSARSSRPGRPGYFRSARHLVSAPCGVVEVAV